MDRALGGQGTVEVAAPCEQVWQALLDPAVLRLLIPGADQVERPDHRRYQARLSFGVGRIRARYDVWLRLSNVRPPHTLDLAGSSRGLLGGGSATAQVSLTDAGPSRAVIGWTYHGVITGPVALAGPGLLRASADRFVHRFFATLARHVRTGSGSIQASPYSSPMRL